MSSTKCAIKTFCHRPDNDEEGGFKINFKGEIYGERGDEYSERGDVLQNYFDSKIIKSKKDSFTDATKIPLDESGVLLFVEDHWWQVHVSLINIFDCNGNDNKDLLAGHEFDQKLYDRDTNEDGALMYDEDEDPDDELLVPDEDLAPIEFTSFNDKKYCDYGIPAVIWSIMIGMLTVDI